MGGMARLPFDDPVAIRLVAAIRSGDLDALSELLDADRDLACVQIEQRGGAVRTPLHVATDWPGYVPRGPDVVSLLLRRGADPDAPSTGGTHAETPLHWAASSDDLEVAAALIDGGADVEAPGGSIAGTPLANAVGYGCWHVARYLVSRGARVEHLWQAAALGLRGRVDELLAGSPPPTPEQIDEAFWQACHGRQRRMAEYLLAHGADINASPRYAEQTALEIAGALDTRTEGLIGWLREHGA